MPPEPLNPNQAVIDRFEGDRVAVLLVGPDATQAIVTASALPAGAMEGDVVLVSYTLEVVALDPNTTLRRHDHLRARRDHARRARTAQRFADDDTSPDDLS